MLSFADLVKSELENEEPLQEGGSTFQYPARASGTNREASPMELILLPPNLVPYLDALAMPQQKPAAEVDRFRQSLASLRGWLDFQNSFSVNDEELSELENLGVLLDEIEQNLSLKNRQAQLDAIVPAVYKVVGIMETVNRRRDVARFSPQPAVNDLILAGAAYTQGRAEDRAIVDRLDRLQEFFSNLRQEFRGAKARLRPEVVQSLEVGIEGLKKGMERAREAVDHQDRLALHDSLAEISEGAEIAQSLVEWQRQDQERLKVNYPRFHIPVVGAMLGSYLEAAKELPKETWDRGLGRLYKEELPKLFLFWKISEKKMYLLPEERAANIERVEASLELLRGALETMADPEASAEEGITSFEDALQDLSDTFEGIRQALPDTTYLNGSPPGDYLNLFMGAIDGHVPVVAFGEMLHSSTPPPEWQPVVDLAVQYCTDLDPDHLYRAIHGLLALYPRPQEEELPQSWTCPSCQTVNELGRKSCAACSFVPHLESKDVTWQG